MVRHSVLRWSVAVLALFGAKPLLANPIQFTGNVANDFKANDPSVTVTPVLSDPSLVGPSAFMTQQGWVSGWAIKDIRTSYDAKTDTLSVGVDTFTNKSGQQAIVGDADGNGDPGGASPQMQAAGGVDNAHLGGHKSVAIAFASTTSANTPGVPVVIAGVPADKNHAGPGIDGFTVSTYRNVNQGLGYQFGNNLAANQGVLAFDPSAAHPGFEFTIKNFSKVPGINVTRPLWMTAYAGSPDDVVVGESALDLTHLPAVSPEVVVPEPATVLGWSLIAGVAALRWRRQRGRAA